MLKDTANGRHKPRIRWVIRQGLSRVNYKSYRLAVLTFCSSIGDLKVTCFSSKDDVYCDDGSALVSAVQYNLVTV